ncbi:hypothetical protein PBI_OMNICRON_9 [Mycobacterium phage Omnicron]|uniref:Uncharacterized protein n=1 Tax=Mycobacterium phage Omnicron TaxID=1541819 RepID=A0A088FRC2_9CAUD|nr:hypothetical protein PBI_OMNICRON_9 [Mycobacterium phage Omnicron]AIM50342.1 hypothetical protein PBI_OMNICRON_9 [Mycobacterium phage Omnicron]
MTGKEDAIAAWREGRAATPGATNPHAGAGQLARMWMLGYKAMLLNRLTNSPARQSFLAAQAAEDAD